MDAEELLKVTVSAASALPSCRRRLFGMRLGRRPEARAQRPLWRRSAAAPQDPSRARAVSSWAQVTASRRRCRRRTSDQARTRELRRRHQARTWALTRRSAAKVLRSRRTICSPRVLAEPRPAHSVRRARRALQAAGCRQNTAAQAVDRPQPRQAVTRTEIAAARTTSSRAK